MVQSQYPEEWLNNVVRWCRYIDDLFVVWKGSVASAQGFVKKLQGNNLNLKLTSTISDKCVNFLDLTVYVSNEKLETKLFRKPTDGNTLLHASSFHPVSLIKSIPYGECLRAVRNCSTKQDLDIELEVLKGRFLARGYPKMWVMSAIWKARQKPREEILFSRRVPYDNSRKENQCRMITSYSNQQGKIRNILQKHWHVIYNDPILGKMVQRRPLLTFRKVRSLKQSLVSNTLPTGPKVKAGSSWLTKKDGFIKCAKCKACRQGKNTTSFKIGLSSVERKIKGHFTCKTEFAVYVLQCPCGLRYVGSMILPVHKRILQHLRAINNGDVTYPVARHFSLIHDRNENLLVYFVLDAIPISERGGDREKKLRRMESRYIILLNSKVPEGLNMEEDFHTHL